MKKLLKKIPVWGWAAAAVGTIGGWYALREGGISKLRSTAEDAGAAAAEWVGDGRAMQIALNALIKAARASGAANVPRNLKIDGRPGAMTCRAAEWAVKTKVATPDIKLFAKSKKCGGGAKRAPCGLSGPVASDAVKKAVLDAIEAKGYTRSEGDATVRRESGWRPAAVACHGADKHPVAGGLLQFISVALKSVGFQGSPDQFAALTGEKQLPYLLKFIKRMPTSKLGRPGDFGLALFMPAYVNKPKDFVIFKVGTLGWKQNPGLRTAGGGPVTVGKVLSTATGH